jgi:hypothetical protein
MPGGPAPQFGFYDVVRVRATPRTVELNVEGKLGAVLGISQQEREPAPVSYAVSLDGVDDTYQFLEQELEATGERRRREDYYSGAKVRVNRHGEIVDS